MARAGCGISGPSSEPKLMRELAFKDRVVQATFSRDNRWVAFGSWDRTIQLVDLKNSAVSQPTELAGHAGKILCTSFSPDSRWLTTGSEDRTTRLWDPTDPSAAPVVLRGHEGSVAHVGFSEGTAEGARGLAFDRCGSGEKAVLLGFATLRALRSGEIDKRPEPASFVALPVSAD